MQAGIQGGMPMQSAMGMGGMPNAMGGMGGMGGMPGGMPGQPLPPPQHHRNPAQTEAGLRYPEPLPMHPQLMPPTAADLLVTAVTLSAQKPYVWSYIDKPQGACIKLCKLVHQG